MMNDQQQPQDSLTLADRSENDKLFALLERAVTVYDHGLRVRESEISLTHAQLEQHENTERLKVERNFELQQQGIKARLHEVDRYYDLERERFNRAFWLIVGVIVFVAVVLTFLLALAPDHDKRVEIVKYTGIAVSLLLGGRGLASLIPSRPRQQPTPIQKPE